MSTQAIEPVHPPDSLIIEILEPSFIEKRMSAACARAQQVMMKFGITEGQTVVTIPPITTEPEYVRLCESSTLAKHTRTVLEKETKPFTDLLYKAHKAAKAKVNTAEVPLEAYEKAVDKATLKWEDKRLEEQQREQARLQQIVNQQTQEQIETTALETAYDLESQGRHDLAAEVLENPQASIPAAAVVMPPPMQFAGQGRRTAWKGRLCGSVNTAGQPDAERVNSIKALCRAIAEGTAPLTLFELNEAALNKLASAMHEQLNIPGCESYPDSGRVKRS